MVIIIGLHLQEFYYRNEFRSVLLYEYRNVLENILLSEALK